jgi:hypothetical protein
MQQHAALTAMVQKLSADLQKKAPELATKVRVAEIQALAGIREAEIKAKQAKGDNDAAWLEQVTDLESDAAAQAREHAFQDAQNAAQQVHERQLAAQPPPPQPAAPAQPTA